MLKRFISKDAIDRYFEGASVNTNGGNLGLAGARDVATINRIEHEVDGTVFVVELHRPSDIDDFVHAFYEAESMLTDGWGGLVFAEVFRDADQAFTRYLGIVAQGLESIRHR